MKTCPHCGCSLDTEKGAPRSAPQLRRFFAVLRAMYHHWPETCEFQPESLEHLRKWALIKAKHRETTDIPLEWADDRLTKSASVAIESAIRAAGTFAFVRPDSNGRRVRVFRAKSIAFAKLGHAEFTRLNDEVEAVYRKETGLEPDEVLKETERAA